LDAHADDLRRQDALGSTQSNASAASQSDADPAEAGADASTSQALSSSALLAEALSLLLLSLLCVRQAQASAAAAASPGDARLARGGQAIEARARALCARMAPTCRLPDAWALVYRCAVTLAREGMAHKDASKLRRAAELLQLMLVEGAHVVPSVCVAHLKIEGRMRARMTTLLEFLKARAEAAA
jgi:hypothetical protein